MWVWNLKRDLFGKAGGVGLLQLEFPISYIQKAAMPLQYFGTVHLVCLHCSSTVEVTVLWWGTLPFFFFFRTVATVVIVFFCLPFVLFFFLLYILFYYTTNFTIFLQLLRCQFLISQNKIIKYETVTNHN